MVIKATRRPRNLDTMHSCGILYGNLGTSKIYVIGLAFAIAGYASPWLIFLVSLLTVMIGASYVVICKYFPNGGGVYSSLRRHSEITSLVGAFFLLADYIITAALSALSAFHYLGVSHPAYYAIGSIILIGLLNIWGPRKMGRFAFLITAVSVLLLLILFFFSLNHIPAALANLKPLSGHLGQDWIAFVGVILTLSGIESAATMTSVMRLDPGSTEEKPKVLRTATKAISFSILETAVFTSFFTLMLCAIPNLVLENDNVIDAKGELIRDSAFRFLGTTFVGEALGPAVGHIFGLVLAIVFAILLLSAVNSAINSMIALFYLMGQDRELPQSFEKMNRFGVPTIPLIAATVLPFIVLLLFDNIAYLASLYAVGFVGAICLNLGASSFDRKLGLRVPERILLAVSALVMLAIEVTLFATKIHAVIYILSIAVIGLLLRGLAREAKERKKEAFSLDEGVEVTALSDIGQNGGALCVVKGRGQALNLAKQWSEEKGEPLCFLFVREQRVMADVDFRRLAESDRSAVKLFNLIHKELGEKKVTFTYVVTDAPAATITHTARWMRAKAVFMDLPRKGIIAHILRGDAVREIFQMLPEEIELFVLPSF